ncbi:MAG TPA: GNAT family N-acetyltransferase, partial [Burkholderiales bacterium]|nr:GNAT family N-acetyltransferase [Burkholderiales bacterium]
MPQPDCSIRPARREDIGHLLELISELAEYEKLTHLLQVEGDCLERDLFGSAPAAEAVLVWTRGDAVSGAEVPAAFALFFHNYSTFLGKRGLWLEDLFVRPAWRQRGFGKALLRHVAQIAVERGCGRFEWSVLDWNTRAIDFYRSLGAVAMDQWT